MNAPDFEGVLAAHQRGGGHGFVVCESRDGRCGWQSGCLSLNQRREGADVDDLYRAHLSAALHAEVARWLADEGTRDAVARAVHSEGFFATHTDRWQDPAWQDRLWNEIATAALAALTTTTQEDS